MAEITEIAQRQGASLGDVGNAYVRVGASVKLLGGGARETAKIVETVGAALRLNNASTTEAASVMRQFGQAMAKGKVNGDEFSSLMENAPTLMDAVAASLGKTKGELYAMAQAGELTSGVFGQGVLGSVHPHARGEHSLTAWRETPKRGSSPRTWGTLARPGAATGAARFIPTHVGNTLSAAQLDGMPAVHPHARGEHEWEVAAAAANNGSSPRTWGTPSDRGHPARRTRFIPTHVGNTAPTGFTPKPQPVHPHARGEHRSAMKNGLHIYGSSPRTWGTRQSE